MCLTQQPKLVPHWVVLNFVPKQVPTGHTVPDTDHAQGDDGGDGDGDGDGLGLGVLNVMVLRYVQRGYPYLWFKTGKGTIGHTSRMSVATTCHSSSLFFQALSPLLKHRDAKKP